MANNIFGLNLNPVGLGGFGIPQGIRNSVGQTLANITNKAGIPHVGLSDMVAGHAVTPSWGQASAYESPVPAYSSPTNASSAYASSANNLPAGGYAPSSGGQSVAGGGGGPVNLQAPVFNPPDTSQVDQLKAAYAQAANDIGGQSGILDQQYGNAKTDIQNSIDQNVTAANTQKQNVDQQFGDVLKNQLQTYQDLGRQRQGTFSALGTLDSSAFGEQQFRADQNLAQDRTRTDTEKTKTLAGVDSQLNAFKQQATSQLAQLATQYQSGKNAIASALANNNLQQAGAIQQALSQVRDQYAQIQNSIVNFANQAQLLKAQGVNVNTGIMGTNGNDYAKGVAQQLQGLVSGGNSMYSIPTQAIQGQGFISPQARAQQDLLKQLGLTQ